MVNHYDEVCEPARAEILADDMYDVVDLYELYTDPKTKLGHTFFTKTNEYAGKVGEQISIPSGVAESMRLQANAFIKRTGGYPNPAADEGEKEGATGL